MCGKAPGSLMAIPTVSRYCWRPWVKILEAALGIQSREPLNCEVATILFFPLSSLGSVEDRPNSHSPAHIYNSALHPCTLPSSLL